MLKTNFMKAVYIFILMGILLFARPVRSQCLQNGYFTTACTGVQTIGGICPTWTNACGAGWTRSHGSPQMVPYTVIVHGVPVTYFYAYMWSWNSTQYGNRGEGMFTPYNFQANRSYDLKIRFSTAVAQNISGSVFVYAASGINQSSFQNCGDAIPNIPQKQLIAQYNGVTNATIDVTATFTPTTNYSQLWIYPLASANTVGGQYDLAVMSVQVCPSCDGVVTYNNGTVPVGETRAGSIYVGSSAGTGGTGTVTVQANQVTNLIGSNQGQVVFLPEFSATVTSGSLTARIESCVSGIFRTEVLDTVNILPVSNGEGNSNGEDSTEMGGGDKEFQRLTKHPVEESLSGNHAFVFPNPSTGKIFIRFANTKGEFFTIEVIDGNGRLLQRKETMTINNETMIDLSNYRNGYYLIKITGKSFTRIEKVLVQ